VARKRAGVAALQCHVAEAEDAAVHAGGVAGEVVLLGGALEQRLGPREIAPACRVVGEIGHPTARRRVLAEAQEQLHALLEQRLCTGAVSVLCAQMAKPAQRPGGAQVVARPARELEPGAEPRLGAPRIAALDRGAPCERERAGAHRRIDLDVEAQQRLQPAHRLALAHAADPERLQRFGERDAERGVARLERQRERRAEVVHVGREPVHPLALPRPARERSRVRGQREHEVSVAPPHRGELAAFGPGAHTRTRAPFRAS
jgi:hypothetical protein